MARLVLGFALAGCAARFEMHGAPETPFDAAIVLGCPSEDDGRLSRCQMSRVLQAMKLWRAGWVRNFIVSGAAVHSPYVEAEALAAGMTALGVPADHIYLEPNALHTDENMYFSLQLARRLRFATLAAVSNPGHSAYGCLMLSDWKQSCRAFSVDAKEVRRLHDAHPELDAVRTVRVRGWVTLADKERARGRRTGRYRLPSYLLYPYIGWLRLNGEVWTPSMPEHVVVETWAERQTR
jgi:hypothetical protein